MSFAILGNEFRRSGNELRHSGNEFRHFLGNEFRPKRTKKSLYSRGGLTGKYCTYDVRTYFFGKVFT